MSKYICIPVVVRLVERTVVQARLRRTNRESGGSSSKKINKSMYMRSFEPTLRPLHLEIHLMPCVFLISRTCRISLSFLTPTAPSTITGCRSFSRCRIHRNTLVDDAHCLSLLFEQKPFRITMQALRHSHLNAFYPQFLSKWQRAFCCCII